MWYGSRLSTMETELQLGSPWSLYFDRYIGPNLPPSAYAKAMVEICTIDSIQTFWNWFNNLPPASELNSSCSYHLMKSGIRPLWFVFGLFLFLKILSFLIP